MTVMYSFCFCCSVRLGAIIVAITSALPTLGCIIACAIGLNNPEKVTEDLRYSEESYHVEWLFLNHFWTELEEDPKVVLQPLLILLIVHFLTCILLIIGAFKCIIWIIYPWIIIELFRLATLSVLVIAGILVVKANEYGLGLVIATSVSGGFFLMYLWYQWFCVISLCQVIWQIRKMEQDIQFSNSVVAKNQKILPQPYG